MVEVGVVEGEDGEILGGLEDAGDRDARLSGVIDGGGGGAAGEALDVHGPALLPSSPSTDHDPQPRPEDTSTRCRLPSKVI